MNQYNEDKTKVCSKCGVELPATLDFFAGEKRGKYGLKSVCRSCLKAINQEYAVRNSEKIKKKRIEYRKNNRDKILAYHKEYHKTHKEQEKQYWEDNKERFAERRRKYYLDNKEQFSEKSKLVREKNKESGRVLFRIYGSKFRSKERGLPCNFTFEDWEYCKDFFNNSCAYCGSSDNLQQDHVIPMSKGGHYSPDNIICSCRSCNASKRASDLDEWYTQKPFFNADRLAVIKHYLMTRRLEDFNSENRSHNAGR